MIEVCFNLLYCRKGKKRVVNCQAIHDPFLFINDKLSIRNGYYRQNNVCIPYT